LTQITFTTSLHQPPPPSDSGLLLTKTPPYGKRISANLPSLRHLYADNRPHPMRPFPHLGRAAALVPDRRLASAFNLPSHSEATPPQRRSPYLAPPIQSIIAQCALAYSSLGLSALAATGCTFKVHGTTPDSGPSGGDDMSLPGDTDSPPTRSRYDLTDHLQRWRKQMRRGSSKTSNGERHRSSPTTNNARWLLINTQRALQSLLPERSILPDDFET